MENSLYQYYSTVTAQSVEWLWYPYIPYGKLTLLQGDPGEGKSTFAIHLAAALTRGDRLPDGTKLMCPETVIYQCAEDNNEDTIKPRLLEAGADCDRVAFILDETDSLTLDDARIADSIVATGARLLIIDPIQSFIRQDGDMQSATRMRAILQRLANIAAKQRCAIVLIGHLNKTSNGKTLYRGLGSIDITAIARSVLMITRDPSQQDIRYMAQIKSSLAPEGSGIAFLMDSETGFHWLGRCSVHTQEISKDCRAISKKERAKQLVSLLLSAGDLESVAVYSQLAEIGISERTVRTAVDELGARAVRRKKKWYLSLPSVQDLDITAMSKGDAEDV